MLNHRLGGEIPPIYYGSNINTWLCFFMCNAYRQKLAMKTSVTSCMVNNSKWGQSLKQHLPSFVSQSSNDLLVSQSIKQKKPPLKQAHEPARTDMLMLVLFLCCFVSKSKLQRAVSDHTLACPDHWLIQYKGVVTIYLIYMHHYSQILLCHYHVHICFEEIE